MQEISISLQHKQKLFLKSIEDFPVTFYGGAKGGGKSYSLRNIFLIRRFQYPGSVGAIFRKTYPELEANHIRPLFNEHPYLRPYWNESKKLLTLPNGSTLQFCHLGSEADIDLYQGREFHDLGIDEVGQWSEGAFRTLHGSNRSSDPNIPARCALTANPGGTGHAWLKRLFVKKEFKENEDPSDYNFIQALVYDNLALMKNDPKYVQRLRAEPNEMLRKAYLDGDWDTMAGQFFSEIRREVHLIKPFNIPPHWTRFGAYDFGFNHPASFGWFACDEDGNVYLYREFVKAGLRVDQFAQELTKHQDTKKLLPIVAGHDCWAKKGVLSKDSAPTIAEEFLKYEIYLERAKIDRIQGASQLRNYVAWQNLASGRTKPRFFIFENCHITYDCLTRMQHDPDNIEDVLKVDATDGDVMTGDDPYDMVRYGLMSRPLLAEPLRDTNPSLQANWEPKHIEKLIAQGQAEEKKKMGLDPIDAPEPSELDDWHKAWNQEW